MVPVTIGLGLINFNAVVDTFFAARLIDRDHAPSAINAAFRLYMLPQGMFSVAVATVLFPSLARLASRGDLDGFRHTVALGPAADRVPAHPGEHRLRGARRADRAPRLPARRVHRRPDAGRRRRARRVLARARLQRLHADAQPRVLQPPAPVAADLGRARQPRPERRPRRAPSIAFGIWGIPLSTSLVNIAGTVALWSSCSGASSGGSSCARRSTPSLRVTAAGIALGRSSLRRLVRPPQRARRLVRRRARRACSPRSAPGSGVYLVFARLLRVRELEALLSLRARLRRA